MPLDNGVLDASPPGAPTAPTGVLAADPTQMDGTADPTQQGGGGSGAPAGGSVGGVLGMLGSVISAPFQGLQAYGAMAQSAIANAKFVQQQRAIAMQQLQARMAGLQELRGTLSKPGDIAAFDSDPIGFETMTLKNRELTNLAGGASLAASTGVATTAPVMGMTKDNVGYTQTPAQTTDTGALPTIQIVTGAQKVSGLAPVGPPAAGIGGPQEPAPVTPVAPTVAASAAAHGAPPIVAVPTPNGGTVQVNSVIATRAAGLLHDLQAAGYNVTDAQGFNNRNVAGTNTASAHSAGLAIDVNPSSNEPHTAGTIPPALARSLAFKYGAKWGGDFKSNPDPMHFTWASSEGGTVPWKPGGPVGGAQVAQAQTTNPATTLGAGGLPTTLSGQAGDTFSPPPAGSGLDPHVVVVHHADGTTSTIDPPVKQTDFDKLGSDYASSTEHQTAQTRTGDLTALSSSIANLPPSAMQSQQALNTFLGSISHANQPRPSTLEDFVGTMGLSEDIHKFLSGNTPGGLGQTITPDSLKQLYRTAYLASAQSNRADAARLAPITANASRYGYDPTPYTSQHPSLPAVPSAMQDPMPPANARTPGMLVWSPRGPARWTGKGWVLQ